jgi:protein-tyrosine phosphatase
MGVGTMAKSEAALRKVVGRAVRNARSLSDRLLQARRRERARTVVASADPRAVLMICLGNICRSPFAEQALSRRLRGADVQISSAGLIGPDRESPENAQSAARQLGVDLGPHRSRLISPASLASSDLIVVMEASQGRTLALRRGVAPAKILVLGDLDPGAAASRDIVDPYGGSLEVFLDCYQRIDRCVTELAAVMLANRRVQGEITQIQPFHR